MFILCVVYYLLCIIIRIISYVKHIQSHGRFGKPGGKTQTILDCELCSQGVFLNDLST